MDLKEIISTALSKTKIERRSKQQIELWNTKRIRDTHLGRPLKKYIDSVKFFPPTESSRISRIRRELTLFLPPSFSFSFYPLFLLPRSNTNFTDTAASYRGKNLVAWYCIRAGRESARLRSSLRCNGHRRCYSWSGISQGWKSEPGWRWKIFQRFSTAYYQW